ncbi:leukocyte elastase inhibitor isoform X2 [Scleropages formosus]|nr:leukocyte elastase inhibitor isoform X2 [Scleropages formosus]XP_018616272.1 leukocyte elastase inhibitor isoform X2 [Scleropages formosus]XP_018616273.1 leukocyte elastase inhibitor isoform X2 [Scleropages formosus]XP_018616274.1 leukocyte elastase inhibitor isoform X2 [Scleropages formosus]XP_018616275.1 leukocyte elastase inhibitor isoform X2 [Scleropages formosus]XP_018616276.1 leukocyte elastase inhibitor isoform X2 [Scleropages formosus]
MDSLSSASTRFALDLFGTLCGSNPTGNVFISPLSITSALAMVYLGARGRTAEQMAKALCLNPDTDIHRGLQMFLSDINKPAAPYLLKLANRLYGEKTYNFLKEFLDSTQKFFHADLVALDFVGAAEETRDQINRWVEDQTEGKIKDLLKPGTVTSTTRLALVNAIYFKGNWLHMFDVKDTKEMLFKINQDESKPVQMMFQKKKFPFSYIHEYGLQILELPYVGEELSMFILLPQESSDGSFSLQKLEKELTLEKLNEWTERNNMDTSTDINVHLPKFKLEDDYKLNEPLGCLGMTDVFDGALADLSGMNGQGGLFLSTVVHKSFIEVNEEGTEAAAATAGLVAFCMFREEHFVADHPFLFFIRHNKSKSILFLGQFSSP